MAELQRIELLRKMLSQHLSSYQSTCQEDPKLKSYDSSLWQQINKLISEVTAQDKTVMYSSLDSITLVSGFLAEGSQNLLKLLSEIEGDVWKNEELKSLFIAYFNSTGKTLNLLNTVKNCANKAKNSRLILQIAINRFETDKSMDTDDLGGNNNKKKYAKTLEELNKVKAMGDPFGDEFMTQYDSVWAQQISLLENIIKTNKKLDKKLKWTKWAKYSSPVLMTAFVSALAILIVASGGAAAPHVAAHVGAHVGAHVVAAAKGAAASKAAEPFVAAFATCLVSSSSLWINDTLKELENTLKSRQDWVSKIGCKARTNSEATKNIKHQIDELTSSIKLILDTGEFALGDEENESATKKAMEAIMKKVDDFTEKIKNVSESVDCHGELILKGREELVQHIANAKGKY